MTLKRYQVFVSSTYKDLVEERSAVTNCLLDNDCIPVGMEQFPAVYDLSNCPIPDYPNCLETAQSCVHNSSF